MNIQELQKFAQVIKNLRGDRSQRDFAKLVGVSSPLIGKWERCENEPGHESLEKVAKLRGQSLSEFMSELQENQSLSNQEPFEKLLERLPHLVKGLDRKQLSFLLKAIAEGLEANQ